MKVDVKKLEKLKRQIEVSFSDEELKQENLPAVRKGILTSLVNHWDGLMVFVDHPDVPMDNSEAERQLRGPAMGRKNYWGSGAKWAGAWSRRARYWG